MHNKKRISSVGIAFGGGGSHSAAHAGAMRALFDCIELADKPKFSGTSGGAITAAQASIGYTKDKEKGLLSSLDQLWEDIKKDGLYFTDLGAQILRTSVFFQTIELTAYFLESQAQITEDLIPNYVGGLWADSFRSVFNLNGGFDKWFRGMHNPLLTNHLKQFIQTNMDLTQLSKKNSPEIFVNAFDIKSQKGIIFSNDEVNTDTLSSSGTLPFLWKPVRYKDKKLIDGKYHANPPIRVLKQNKCKEIFVISLSTLEKDNYLKKELALLKNELGASKQKPIIHLIELDIEGDLLTKLQTDSKHIEKVKTLGHDKMKAWLDLNHQNLGKRSTIDWNRVPDKMKKVKRKISL